MSMIPSNFSSSNAYSTNVSSTALAHATHVQQNSRKEQTETSFEFEPVPKHPMFVIGEQVRNLFDFVYSRLPTFSLLGAQASTITTCDLPAVCVTPTGTYEKSCHKPEVTYLPSVDRCELTTRCETIFEGLPHQRASFRFTPGSLVELENSNGTLVESRSREERVNAKLDELSKIALAPEDLVREQEAIIGDLKAGDVITVNDDLYPAVVPPEKWIKGNEAFNAFQRIASATGGIMGHSPSSTSLNPLIEKMSAHILKAAEESEFVDIAFVLDTTSSMEPYIQQVKNNLVQFLQQLTKKKATACRVALLEYRDKDDKFLNRVNTGFTSNLNQVEEAVKSLKTEGGGDLPEAVLDALLAAKNKLSWQPKAKRIVILIGDAPPQPKTQDGRHDEVAVISEYQTAGTQIAVYPIFSQNEKTL